jgi:ABC-2 type transport system permease protein
MVIKEFRQLLRDRRTLGLLVGLPIILLVVFGYAANFEVSKIPTLVVGPRAAVVASRLQAPFHVTQVDPGGGRALAKSRLQDGEDVVGVVTGASAISVMMDGTQLFSVQTAKGAFARLAEAEVARGGTTAAVAPEILYNPDLKTSWIMIPGLTGLILLFIGTLITSLGVVRERQAGTIEQLAVMPFRPWDVILGKILPYLLLATLDLIAIVVLGMALFRVPFVGSVLTFGVGALLFLLVTLGMGVLISTVSQNQGQAIQLAIMFVVPQILLSGLIFPVNAMAQGVRWIAYVLPLTYFVEVSRGVMLKAEPISALWFPIFLLLVLASAVLSLAVLRFRRDLAPNAGRRLRGESEPLAGAG